MALEIERRFLVKGESWKDYATSSQNIRQGYLSINFEEWITRVRIVNENKAFIGLKSSLDGLINNEFEYIIPIQDAEFIWNKLNQKISKQRYFLNLDQGLWIIDCFKDKNFPLIIAEVELKNTQSFSTKPSWCEKEITGEKQLSNASLAKFPISNWPAEKRKLLDLD